MSDEQDLKKALDCVGEMVICHGYKHTDNRPCFKHRKAVCAEINRLRAQLSEQAARADSFKDTCEELRERTDQFDWKTGECERGIIGNYSTCNGSNKGCERSRFLHCCYCMKRDFMNKQRAEAAEQKLKAVEGERDSLRFQALNSTPTAELLRRTLEAENGRDAYMALVNQAQDGQNRAEADLETASKENAELRAKLVKTEILLGREVEWRCEADDKVNALRSALEKAQADLKAMTLDRDIWVDAVKSSVDSGELSQDYIDLCRTDAIRAFRGTAPAEKPCEAPHCHVCCDGSDPRHITCASEPKPECTNHVDGREAGA